jgi:hypothetical protein
VINRFVFASIAAAALEAELASLPADGVIAGHAGIPFARRAGDRLWLNAGAIGMPANDGTPRVWFALLTPEPDGIRVEILPLAYDHETAARRMREKRLPEGYARALASGLWPSLDVLPPQVCRTRCQALAPQSLHWPRAGLDKQGPSPIIQGRAATRGAG